MSKFDEWRAKRGYSGLPGFSEHDFMVEAWNAAISEAREAALSVATDAHEAAKAKDATDYVAGYQDATIEVDEVLRELLIPPPR